VQRRDDEDDDERTMVVVVFTFTTKDIAATVVAFPLGEDGISMQVLAMLWLWLWWLLLGWSLWRVGCQPQHLQFVGGYAGPTIDTAMTVRQGGAIGARRVVRVVTTVGRVAMALRDGAAHICLEY
jgi:hypothetical protein